MDTVEAIVKVLVVGLILGAGLPALFAIGLRLFLSEPATVSADGRQEPASQTGGIARYLGIALFTLVAAVIVVAIAWITRSTIDYYLGIDLFPFMHGK